MIHLWRVWHDDFSDVNQSQVLQSCHIAQLCHLFTVSDRQRHSCWAVVHKNNVNTVWWACHVCNAPYCCVLTTGIRSWWVCLQLCSPVAARTLLLSELSRWDSWMEARPISWSLLLGSLCQTSTTRGTLWVTGTQNEFKHCGDINLHMDWMFRDKTMSALSPITLPTE